MALVGGRTVHHAVFVIEDPKIPDLVSQLHCLGLGVFVGDADENEDSGSDFARHVVPDSHPGPTDPLHQSPHGSQPTLR